MMPTLKLPRRYLTYGSLGGLVLGLALGIAAKQSGVEALVGVSEVLEPVGMLWINALRMIVLPLLVAYIVTAVASFSEVRSTFRVGGGAVGVHLLLLLLGMGLMLAVVPGVAGLFEVTPAIRDALQAAAIAPPPGVADAPPPTLRDTVVAIIPTNVLRAAADDQILPLFVAAFLFALALTRVGAAHRAVIVGFFEALIATLHVLVGWILRAMPLGVFALVFAMAAQAGTELLGALVFFVVMFSGLLLLLTALLYVVTPLLGRVPLARFAAAAAPAQAVAVGTRSSIVCLPALVEGARDRLGLPEQVVGIVLPLSVSMFKINKAVSGPAQVFFLAHLYGVALEPLAVAGFLLAYIPTSFSSPGIPSGGFFLTLPLYIALGIPVEGVVLLKAVDAIPDIFKTVVNVTGDLSVATLVARFAPETVSALPA